VASIVLWTRAVATRGGARIALVAGAAVLVFAPSARANGRFPTANAIVFSQSSSAGGALTILRTTFGLVVSQDAGATWRWVCEDAFGLSASSIEDPSLALTPSGGLVAGSSNGLWSSSDHGCSWKGAGGPLARAAIKDLVVLGNEPHSILALASTFALDAGVEGGVGFLTQVFESGDGGANWSILGTPIDGSIVVTTLDVAEADPHRLYVSGTRGYGSTRATVLLVSTNDGAAWIERRTPFDPNTEAGIYIAAVDPADPDRVYLRSDGQSRLMVTSDAGQSFSVPLGFTGPMNGFALSEDGSTVYAGGIQDGLYVASKADLSFRKISALHVRCLAVSGNQLWACSDEVSGFAVGVSNDHGTHFTPVLHLADVRGPIACDAESSAAQCTVAAFEQVCATIDGCVRDAGATTGDAMADGATGPADPQVRVGFGPGVGKCGCTLVGPGESTPLFAAAVAAGVLCARRVTRRVSSPSSVPRCSRSSTRACSGWR
jgi:photosystem II stability/assembly factor-like uncharacterized protein